MTGPRETEKADAGQRVATTPLKLAGLPRLLKRRPRTLVPVGTRVPFLKRPGSPGPASAPAASAPETPAVPRGRLPAFFSLRYKLKEPINEGGMGLVYRARDTMLGMDVALKFLPPAMNRNPEAIEILKREAVMAMTLSHKNIVRLHNVEKEGQRLFIVMEYVDGETLRDVLQRLGKLSLESVMGVARACAAALEYAHGQQILHRDIKPENLMIDRDGRLKIVDFGLATRVRSAPGKFVEGTPGYMSPEELRGEALDVRTDIFSLGAVLCELLTGKAAFPDRSDLKRLFDSPPEGLAELAQPLQAVLARALDLDRERRWASVTEFWAALEKA